MKARLTVKDWESAYAELQAIVVKALDAMDAGLRGDARRLLVTGKDLPVTSSTGVIAK